LQKYNSHGLIGPPGPAELQKQHLSVTKSLSGCEKREPQFTSPFSRGIKFSQSMRVKRDGGGPKSKADRTGWSFGSMAKGIGTGMVQGTKAVGSGVYQGSYAVGNGVVQGSKVVSNGMVQGVQNTLAATKDVTLAVGKGVSAAGEASLSASRVVTNASVKWVKEQSEGLGNDDLLDTYTVLPGDTLEDIGSKNNINIHNLIRLNNLNQRKLFPGRRILLHSKQEEVNKSHPEELLTKKGLLKSIDHDKVEILVTFTPEKISAALTNDNKVIQFDFDELSKLHLDISEDIESIPDLLPAKLAPTNIKIQHDGEDFQMVEVSNNSSSLSLRNDHSGNCFVSLELESKSICYTLLFQQENLLSLYAYLDLWQSEKLQISNLFSKQLNITALGWADDSEQNPQILEISSILNRRNIKNLYLSLPQKVWGQAWQLAYSTGRNGFSLLNFYRTLGEDSNPCLIVINDSIGYNFGAFLTCTPTLSERFIGTGKSWLFTFGRLDRASGQKKNQEVCVVDSSILHVYNWSGKNDYFFKGTQESMIIGASNGNFGIIIDSDLRKGRIHECETFEGWAPQERDFLINCLECWKFV